MEDGGPFVQAALFCEKVLREVDGVASFIRIVDRFTITATGTGAPEKMPESTVSATLVIALKSGFYRGSLPVRIETISPSGTKTSEAHFSVLLEGEDRGANLNVNLRLTVKEDGVFWIAIYGQDQLLTRVPIRIVYQRVHTQGTASPGLE